MTKRKTTDAELKKAITRFLSEPVIPPPTVDTLQDLFRRPYEPMDLELGRVVATSVPRFSDLPNRVRIIIADITGGLCGLAIGGGSLVLAWLLIHGRL